MKKATFVIWDGTELYATEAQQIEDKIIAACSFLNPLALSDRKSIFEIEISAHSVYTIMWAANVFGMRGIGVTVKPIS